LRDKTRKLNRAGRTSDQRERLQWVVSRKRGTNRRAVDEIISWGRN